MATTFLTVVGAIPWQKVIDQAPQLAEQAQKLVARLRQRRSDEAPATPGDTASPLLRVEAAEAQIAVLEGELAKLSDVVMQLSQSQLAIARQMRSMRMVSIGSIAVLLVATAALIVHLVLRGF